MRRRPREQDVNEIVVPSIRDNQTWNDCPECHLAWESKPSIPGVIHRTRLCDKCLHKNSRKIH